MWLPRMQRSVGLPKACIRLIITEVVSMRSSKMLRIEQAIALPVERCELVVYKPCTIALTLRSKRPGL